MLQIMYSLFSITGLDSCLYANGTTLSYI